MFLLGKLWQNSVCSGKNLLENHLYRNCDLLDIGQIQETVVKNIPKVRQEYTGKIFDTGIVDVPIRKSSIYAKIQVNKFGKNCRYLHASARIYGKVADRVIIEKMFQF